MKDEQQDENKLIAQRRHKFAAIRSAETKAETKAHSNKIFRNRKVVKKLLDKYEERSRESLEAKTMRTTIAGRVVRMRGPFVVIQDDSGHIQVYMNNKDYKEELAEELAALDLGDIIGIKGTLFKTGKDELTVRAESFRILAKALRPLPDKHKGLQDTELRYRQRYLDLIANEDSRRVFKLRSQTLKVIRRYLEKQGFMEVETPMMQPIPGGAIAHPFETHHRALNQAMYLRVAPELYLKRLVVGGFEKVFELNRSFRNEGLSTKHNPEFTMLEFYWAYADYEDLMAFTEKLLCHISEEVLDSCKFPWQGINYDFSKPFARLTMAEAVCQYCNLSNIEVLALSNNDSIKSVAKSLGVNFDPAWPAGKILLEIYEQKVEQELEQPTFITEYPTVVSPLSRRNEANPDVTDRFELIIAGRELANGFSELNDPEDQAERFKEQAAQREAGNHEAMPYDRDYVKALEYGMPPTAGEGIGIDRLVMLLADVPSIRDVLLFPHTRPQLTRD
ncbi:MAG: lysine--tRNA ligase [Pseudohongiellaceae bacterium]